jgi:hypothetical protein
MACRMWHALHPPPRPSRNGRFETPFRTEQLTWRGESLRALGMAMPKEVESAPDAQGALGIKQICDRRAHSRTPFRWSTGVPHERVPRGCAHNWPARC